MLSHCGQQLRGASPWPALEPAGEARQGHTKTFGEMQGQAVWQMWEVNAGLRIQSGMRDPADCCSGLSAPMLMCACCLQQIHGNATSFEAPWPMGAVVAGPIAPSSVTW